MLATRPTDREEKRDEVLCGMKTFMFCMKMKNRQKSEWMKEQSLRSSISWMTLLYEPFLPALQYPFLETIKVKEIGLKIGVIFS